MSPLELRDSMLVPFALLFALGGLYLTIRLRLYRFPYNFLGIKLLSGTLDWKAKKGKLSPVEAISAGSGYQMTVGALLGGILAYVLAGPGILFWIWVSCFLVMPFDFVAGNLSNRARLKGPRNVPLLGPARYIHQGLRGRWLAFLFAVLFIITALIMGGAFPVVVAHHYMQTVFPISAASLGISLGILWIFMVAGGIRRIGVAARYTVSYSGVITIVALALLFVSLWFVQDYRATRINILDFFGHAIYTIIPGNRIELVQKAMGVITFWVLTGNAGGTLATLTGAIRTNFPAKAGLASMPSAMIAAFLFAPIAVYLGWAFYAELDTARLLERVLNNPGHSSQWVGYISALALLGFSLAALGGWSYAGQQAARFLGGTIPATAFYIMFLITIIGTGLLLELDRIGFVEILAVSMIWFMFSTIINVVATIMQTGAARADLIEYMESDQARMTISRDFLLLFFHLLPKNLVSRLFGYFSMFHFPRIVRLPLLRWFARTYKIDLTEAEKPLEEYASLNQFFTRALKPGIRPVHQSRDGVVSPVDGVLSRMGYINDGFMVQAKGIMYSLEDLLEGSEQTHLFEGGTYCVLYLSPQDYHRIHSPVEGRVLSYTYAPGQLFPVNMLAVNDLYGLFPKNERLTSYVQTDHGMVAVVKVGATNVGRIRVTYDRIATNRWLRFWKTHIYTRPHVMERGAELGRFEMGSTVILVFERDCFEFDKTVHENMRVRYGQLIGKLKEPGRTGGAGSSDVARRSKKRGKQSAGKSRSAARTGAVPRRKSLSKNSQADKNGKSSRNGGPQAGSSGRNSGSAGTSGRSRVRKKK